MPRTTCCSSVVQSVCNVAHNLLPNAAPQAVQSDAMESVQIQALYEPPLAAKPQLSEKPHQGFATRQTASHQGSSVCNFTVTLGLQATVVENGVRETYSARYYNPATGRFLSRDTEDGFIDQPATLHKYLYANGDPVNWIDPTGRASSMSYALPLGIISVPITTVEANLMAGMVGCAMLWVGGNVWANSVVASNGGYVVQLPCFALPMSKGGNQYVIHQYVLDMAKAMGGDLCAALKKIRDQARKAGNSSLFWAASATYKAVCRY